MILWWYHWQWWNDLQMYKQFKSITNDRIIRECKWSKLSQGIKVACMVDQVLVWLRILNIYCAYVRLLDGWQQYMRFYMVLNSLGLGWIFQCNIQGFFPSMHVCYQIENNKIKCCTNFFYVNVEEWHNLFHVELSLVGCGNDKVWNAI